MIIVASIKLLLINAVSPESLSAVLESLLVMREAVSIVVVMKSWHLVAVQIEGWLVQRGEDILFVVILEGVVERSVRGKCRQRRRRQ